MVTRAVLLQVCTNISFRLPIKPATEGETIFKSSNYFRHIHCASIRNNTPPTLKSWRFRRYQSYFHDGSIIDIQHHNETLRIALESAQILDIIRPISLPLSKQQTLKGVLQLQNASTIFVNKKPIMDSLKMLGDSGQIVRLRVYGNTLRLFIEWTNYPPKPVIETYSDIVVRASKVLYVPEKC